MFLFPLPVHYYFYLVFRAEFKNIVLQNVLHTVFSPFNDFLTEFYSDSMWILCLTPYGFYSELDSIRILFGSTGFYADVDRILCGFYSDQLDSIRMLTGFYADSIRISWFLHGC